MDNFEYEVCSVIESYLDEFEPVHEIGDTWSTIDKTRVGLKLLERGANKHGATLKSYKGEYEVKPENVGKHKMTTTITHKPEYKSTRFGGLLPLLPSTKNDIANDKSTRRGMTMVSKGMRDA